MPSGRLACEESAVPEHEACGRGNRHHDESTRQPGDRLRLSAVLNVGSKGQPKGVRRKWNEMDSRCSNLKNLKGAFRDQNLTGRQLPGNSRLYLQLFPKFNRYVQAWLCMGPRITMLSQISMMLMIR